tara:strand:- start:732 stop:1511 length:780 start_codon:yes stop_codon:yes gene_type:complete
MSIKASGLGPTASNSSHWLYAYGKEGDIDGATGKFPRIRYWDGKGGLDTEELFEKNIKKYPQKMKPWITTPIKYDENMYGFRCPNPLIGRFGGQKYMAVGCSRTYGQGVLTEQSWPEQLGKMLPGVMYNMGVRGGSLETCYRLVKWWAPLIKPKAVFMLSPASWRRERVTDDVKKIASICEGHDLAYNLKRIGTDDSDKVHHECIVDAIQYNCDKVGAKLFVLSQYWGGDKVDVARDLVHPGPKQHKIWADKFYSSQNR